LNKLGESLEKKFKFKGIRRSVSSISEVEILRPKSYLEELPKKNNEIQPHSTSIKVLKMNKKPLIP
jgi:hypothetical protein